MVDQTGYTVHYSYTALGQLAGLSDATGPIVVYSYNAAGQLASAAKGNGTYTNYSYDSAGDVMSVINYAPGGTVNSSFVYAYNDLGLETSETTIDGAWLYTYDPTGQLIHAVFASTNASMPGQDLAYSYDGMGNRITTVINGATTAYATNDRNEYTSVGGIAETYDKNGNLLSDGTNAYGYNALNQLASVIGPSATTTYTYNALGQRESASTNGVTTQYLTDPSGLGNVVGQYTSAGSLIANYTYGLGLTSQVTASGSHFYDFDSLGSTVGVTDAAGSYVNRYSYLPFGGSLAATQGITNPFQYVGQAGVMAEPNGLQFMRARYMVTAL
jgi:YD repeat-containing protein